jgi:hypothetical protein
VEGLVDIANVMDEETKSVGLGKISLSRVESILNVLVHIAFQVIVAVLGCAKPLNNSFHSVGQVVLRVLVTVVLGVTVRVPCFGLEVEIGLPGSTVVLDVISKCGALNEGVVVFSASQSGILFMQESKQVNSLIQGIRRVYQELILSNIRSYKTGQKVAKSYRRGGR